MTTLFETMAMDLDERRKEFIASPNNIPLKHDATRPPFQRANDPLPQTSLVVADSTAFYNDAAFFANLPKRVRLKKKIGISHIHLYHEDTSV